MWWFVVSTEIAENEPEMKQPVGKRILVSYCDNLTALLGWIWGQLKKLK